VLFIEKEGFLPLLRKAQIDTRFDLALMSTKGMASTAARSLMETLSWVRDVRFLALRDFDKAGFSICATLTQDTDRYQFQHTPDVIDLGLGLEPEPCRYHERDPAWNLQQNGATPEEIAFLVTGPARGQRVELNAMSSNQFVLWLEEKLEEAGVEKVIPDDQTLTAAYRRAVYLHAMNAALKTFHAQAEKAAKQVKVPKTLRRQVKQRLKEDPTYTWDDVIADFAPASPATGTTRRKASRR